MKQQILIVEGPDKSGKSTVGKLIAKELNIPYFKPKNDKEALNLDTDFSSKMLQYCDPYFVDMLQQTKFSLVIDRHFPSEWCYSSVMGRKTDEERIWKTDELFSKISAKILIFKRNSYAGEQDEDVRINDKVLEKLSSKYDEFAKLTKCEKFIFTFDKFDSENMKNVVLETLKGS